MMNTTPRRLGKYELQEPLGRGGMAEVWKALDTQLRRIVAIKLLHANLQTDPDFMTRFMHEAQVIAALRHPNIVQIYDFHISEPAQGNTNDANTIAYMVMEYIKGQTLATYIQNTSHRKLFPSADTIVRLFIPISSALDYAHQQGTIHRDIKPANILLDQDNTSRNPMGEPILSDFGLAKLLNAESQTMTGMVFGTPLYISPEQVQGKQVSSRSDLYSLGIMLYEIFTGERPFQSDSLTGIMLQHINETPKVPYLVNPKLPHALSPVLLKSLAKNPQDRYASASEMIEDVAKAFEVTIPIELQLAVDSLHGKRISPAAPTPHQSQTLDTENEATIRASEPFALDDYKTAPTPSVRVESKRNPTSSAGIVPVPAFDVRDQQLMSAETIASSEPEVNSPGREQYVVQEPQRVQRERATDTPLPVIPPPVVPQQPLTPAQPTPPPARKKRRGWLIAAIVVLVLLIIGSGLTALLLTNNSASTASVGSAYFISSGKVNETTNQGANDEFQINLHNIAAPSSGRSYFAWLMSDSSQVEGPTILLGKLPFNNGTITYIFPGDGQHTNLLATYSRFLITEEDANATPLVPSPDKTQWKYYAAIPQTIPSGKTFSLLDHLRHLLTNDPDLQKLHTPLPGGLAIWTYRDTQKLAFWANDALNNWKTQNFAVTHKRIIETLDYLDGSQMVAQDVPPGTPLMADPLPSQVPLLTLQPNQQPPGYLQHDATHLNGVVASPGSTPNQSKLASQIDVLLNTSGAKMQIIRQDAIKLAGMSNIQLSQPTSQAILQDMFTQSNEAFTGTPNYVTTMQGAKGGITIVYEDIQKLAMFDVTPFKQG